LSKNERKHKDEDKNKGDKTMEMVSAASPLARSDVGLEHVDL